MGTRQSLAPAGGTSYGYDKTAIFKAMLRTWTITNLPLSLGSNQTVYMTIERTADAIIVKLPTNINIEEIQRFLNYLRYKEIVARSKATQEDVDKLAREVNKSWWEKNKHRFLPGE